MADEEMTPEEREKMASETQMYYTVGDLAMKDSGFMKYMEENFPEKAIASMHSVLCVGFGSKIIDEDADATDFKNYIGTIAQRYIPDEGIDSSGISKHVDETIRIGKEKLAEYQERVKKQLEERKKKAKDV